MVFSVQMKLTQQESAYNNIMDKGNKSTFGRSLQQFVSNALPYRSPAAIIDDVQGMNPKYKEFYKAGTLRQDLLSKHSVVTPPVPDSDVPVGSFLADRAYNQLMYATLDVDKGKRLRDYRTMSVFAEVADALDEICDDFMCEDDNGEIIKLMFRDVVEFDPLVSKQLNEEFRKFINIFELKEKGWEYLRYLLIDGELYFENIIHKDHPESGILGAISIPTHLIDPVYDNYQNMAVKAYLLRKLKHHKEETGTAPTHQKDKDFIPLDKNQVTYINSGTWNEDKTFRVPFIENARRAYRQLTMVEDSIIIYRLVRAPERLIFNVDVGNMAPPKAEAYMRKLMQNYWSKKTFNLDEGSRVNSFNPQSILDAFWFPKREGSEGTNVTTLPGGANLGELQDLVYFIKKLYKALKVPTNRADLESTYTGDSTVLREELKFANFIIRLQQRFARGLKESFVTHLKLKGLWKNFDLRENVFDLEFTPPRNYYELRKQQVLDLKLNNFNTVTQNESISKGYAQKMFLGWNDEQIKANREWLRKDASLQHEISQIQEGGDNWQAGAAAAGADAGGVPQGGDVPPDFGPTGGLGDDDGLDDIEGAEEAPPETPEPSPEA